MAGRKNGWEEALNSSKFGLDQMIHEGCRIRSMEKAVNSISVCIVSQVSAP